MIHVDTNLMEDAYYRLRKIENEICAIEAEMEYACAVLRCNMDGGGAVTELMVKSLNSQIKAIDRRLETAEQLKKVLHSAKEQYLKCEEDAKPEQNDVSEYFAVVDWNFFNIIRRRIPPIRPVIILPEIAIKFTESYIIPLIVTGESAV